MKKQVPVVTQPHVLEIFTRMFSDFVEVDTVNELTSNMYSKSSLLAITKDWNLFVEFCQSKSVKVIPASATAVRLYIENVAKQRKYATVKRYAVTISLIHRTLGYADPTQNARVQMALGAIRVNKHGDQQSTRAFTDRHLESLQQTMSRSSSIKDWRDLAIYHVMYEGLLKRYELRELTMEQLSINDDYISMFIGSDEITLSNQASITLYRWLKVRGKHSGYVFTAIDRHENISNKPLNDSSIYRILRSASDILGLDFQFSSQSLRVGATQQLAQQGVQIKDIQHAGRWLSPAMPYQYIGNRSEAELEKMRFVSLKYID